MIEKLKENPRVRRIRALLDRLSAALGPEVLLEKTFVVATTLIVLAAIYWGAVASDRYVSQASVEIERTDMAGAASMDFSALLTGVGGGRKRSEERSCRERV